MNANDFITTYYKDIIKNITIGSTTMDGYLTEDVIQEVIFRFLVRNKCNNIVHYNNSITKLRNDILFEIMHQKNKKKNKLVDEI